MSRALPLAGFQVTLIGRFCVTPEANTHHRRHTMPARNPREVFLMLLSNVRNRTERQGEIYQEIGKHAEEPEVKEAIEGRAFVSKQILAKLDECFRIIGEKPVDSTGKLQETFLEDFRKEVAEIQSPLAKRLFVLAKLNHLAHLRMAEYEVLIAAADLAGHHGVGVLLETCLADKLAFAERNRRLIRRLVEERLAERAAGASA